MTDNKVETAEASKIDQTTGMPIISEETKQKI
jgi:hypothetical protein